MKPSRSSRKNEGSRRPKIRQQRLIGSNWPSLPLPSESESLIQPRQRSKSPSPIKSPWKVQQRNPEDYERDRVGKYAEYFKGNEILPIPEIVQKLEPRILTLVVTDIKTRRLVGFKKEGFEDLLRKVGVLCQYICRRSFATWDVLRPSKEQAAKVASNNITTKFFRLQPEYMGIRRIRVTAFNVPAFITGEVLASFHSAYGRVEEINLLRSAAGTAYGDYTFLLYLTREGFQAIPEVIVGGERQMMVVVSGRRPRCWGCKQLGHIAKFCLKKDQQNAAVTTVTTATISSEPPTKATKEKDPGQVQSKPIEHSRTDGKKRKPQKKGKSDQPISLLLRTQNKN